MPVAVAVAVTVAVPVAVADHSVLLPGAVHWKCVFLEHFSSTSADSIYEASASSLGLAKVACRPNFLYRAAEDCRCHRLAFLQLWLSQTWVQGLSMVLL